MHSANQMHSRVRKNDAPNKAADTSTAWVVSIEICGEWISKLVHISMRSV